MKPPPPAYPQSPPPPAYPAREAAPDPFALPPPDQATAAAEYATAWTAWETWNAWDTDHPALRRDGQPKKRRQKKRPVDALAVVRVAELSLTWDLARAVAEAQQREEEEAARLDGLDG